MQRPQARRGRPGLLLGLAQRPGRRRTFPGTLAWGSAPSRPRPWPPSRGVDRSLHPPRDWELLSITVITRRDAARMTPQVTRMCRGQKAPTTPSPQRGLSEVQRPPCTYLTGSAHLCGLRGLLKNDHSLPHRNSEREPKGVRISAQRPVRGGERALGTSTLPLALTGHQRLPGSGNPGCKPRSRIPWS